MVLLVVILQQINIIDRIRLTAPGFIITTFLTPIIAGAALASIRHLRNSDIERKTHQMVVAKVKNMFKNAKINYIKNTSHIIPIIIGDPVKTRQSLGKLFKN